LKHTADAIRQTGDQMRQQDQVAPVAQYADRAAGAVERFAGYLQERDTNQIVRDVERMAREKPVMFLASAFALGLTAVRFFKSSPASGNSGQYGGELSNRQLTASASPPMQRTTPAGTPPSGGQSQSPTGTSPAASGPSGTTPSGTTPSRTTPGQAGSTGSPAATPTSPGQHQPPSSPSTQTGQQPSNTPGTPTTQPGQYRPGGSPGNPPPNRG
jgi:hypothetical protein